MKIATVEFLFEAVMRIALYASWRMAIKESAS
jgi:hypothetical protein